MRINKPAQAHAIKCHCCGAQVTVDRDLYTYQPFKLKYYASIIVDGVRHVAQVDKWVVCEEYLDDELWDMLIKEIEQIHSVDPFFHWCYHGTAEWRQRFLALREAGHTPVMRVGI